MSNGNQKIQRGAKLYLQGLSRTCRDVWTAVLLVVDASIAVPVSVGRGYFAECSKLSRGNLQKIKCGTFHKLPHIAFQHSAVEKFCASADGKTSEFTNNASI